jgi:iron-sulfur-dependent L-serine dehydratase beta subunit
MEKFISVFDMFKISVGPSSSHTLGPWLAAKNCIQKVDSLFGLDKVKSIQVLLYGSLAKTGKGHGTAMAVMMGLMEEDPITTNTDLIEPSIAAIKINKKIVIDKRVSIEFDLDNDLLFLKDKLLPHHPNGLEFIVTIGAEKHTYTYYSIGGGFIEEQIEKDNNITFNKNDNNNFRKEEINGNKFNTQNEDELGGCSSKNDIECNMLSERDISIEIKKLKTPDWMQCSLKYDNINNKWIGSIKNKIPEASKKVFEELISKITLFNGNIPPFMLKDITHEEWVKTKKETTDYNDSYIDCPNDTIMKLYGEKDCSYIQISEKGLYHLGNDVCDFKVPAFICEQRLRVRTKIHEKKNKKGFCKLSVTIACQPKNIKNLINSEYSLDTPMKLPLNLSYDD